MGKPLGKDEGPFRLVVPDEKHPTRWVHQVTTLKSLSLDSPAGRFK